MKSDYVLDSCWGMACDRESLWDEIEALLDSDDPLRWWPSVQVVSREQDAFDVIAASHLGYSLRFRLSQLRTCRPDRLTLRSDGDLRGTCVLRFVDTGPETSQIQVDWRVATGPRWMHWTSWLLRPLFVAGHHLVMRQGEKHLSAYLVAQGRSHPR